MNTARGFVPRDESLEESNNLPDPDVLAQETIEDLEITLEQFREAAADLGADVPTDKECCTLLLLVKR